MSEASASTSKTPPTSIQYTQDQSHLLGRVLALEERTVEQHFFVFSLIYIVDTTFMPSEAPFDAAFERFKPNLLCHSFCLKVHVLYVHLRNVIHSTATVVDRRRGLYISQVTVNKSFQPDKRLRTKAFIFIPRFKFASS